MSKVTVPLTSNPHFKEEVSDYLVAHGYKRTDGTSGTISFSNGKKLVIVKNDNVDFMVYQDGEPNQRRKKYSRYEAHTGIGDLDLFKWMLLLHITDIVPLKELVRRAKMEASEDVNELAVQIFKHFQATDDHNAVPVNY